MSKVADVNGGPTISKPKAEKQSSGGLATLYRFADGVDLQLMIIGMLLALIQAVLPPFVWLVMGDFVSFAIEREVCLIVIIMLLP